MKEKNNNKSSEQFQNQPQFSIDYGEFRINWEKNTTKSSKNQIETNRRNKCEIDTLINI
jgi:hypothetical protein